MVSQDVAGHNASFRAIALIMKHHQDIREEITAYVNEEIIPQYENFDSAHRTDHALTVIGQAMELLDRMPEQTSAEGIWNTVIDREMLYVAAACHDLGLVNGRERHHIDSGTVIRNDMRLREWFSEEQIETMAQAAEDHRASGKSAPRSVYGMLVAESDRVIDGDTIILRTIQFGFSNYPGLNREEHIQRAVSHLKEKYGRGGYLKLWIPWSDNAARLSALQDIIADDEAIRRKTGEIYDAYSNSNSSAATVRA